MDCGEARSEEPGVTSGEKGGGSEAELGDDISVAFGDALDESMEAEPTQVVGHPAENWLGTKPSSGAMWSRSS